MTSAAASILSDLDSLPYVAGDVTVVLTHALACIEAGEPTSRFRGMRNGFAFSARADLYVIQAAWSAGCDFEALADGFGRGIGTAGGDWSGIRDSSERAIVTMTAKAVRFIREAR